MQRGNGPINWGAPINRRHPLAAGLIGFWLPQAGQGGNTMRDLAGTNPGALYGDAVLAASNAPGHQQQITLDGTGDYIRVENTPSLNPTNITISALVRIDSSNSSYQAIVMKRANAESNQAAYAYDYSTAGFRFYFNTGGSWNIWGSNGLTHTDGNWEHCVVTYDAAGAPTFYINGVAATSAPTVILGSGNPALPSNNTWLGFGSWENVGGTDINLAGSIGSVLIHGYGMTNGGVASLYQEVLKGFPSLISRMETPLYLASASSFVFPYLVSSGGGFLSGTSQAGMVRGV